MRRSKTLARIRQNDTARIACLGHYVPAYLKHAAHFGYDCIWLDLEHRNFSDRDVSALLAMSHLHDIDVMVRPPTLEKVRLYRYLEDGAAGLLIPHVNTAERARMLVDAVKFPPVGDRGLDAAGLDADFLVGGLDGVNAYIEHTHRETFLIVQIETPQAVDNVAEIAAVPGVDGLFIGPGDLGLRIEGYTVGQIPESIYEEVATVCRENDIVWGTPVGSREDLQRRRQQGGQLLAHGGDFRAMMEMLRRCAADYE